MPKTVSVRIWALVDQGDPANGITGVFTQHIQLGNQKLLSSLSIQIGDNVYQFLEALESLQVLPQIPEIALTLRTVSLNDQTHDIAAAWKAIDDVLTASPLRERLKSLVIRSTHGPSISDEDIKSVLPHYASIGQIALKNNWNRVFEAVGGNLRILSMWKDKDTVDFINREMRVTLAEGSRGTT
jgi:hypothetical protein